MDVFSSERALVDNGAVDHAMKTLDEKGLIYKGVLEPPKGKTPKTGSRENRRCSVPASSETIPTGPS